MIPFIIIATLAVVGAVGVVTLKQPVHAALSLVGTLLSVALAYVQLNANFLAATQVIVYAGAIMVLFLFVIMLLNVGGEEDKDPVPLVRRLAWPAAGVTAFLIAYAAFSDPRVLPDGATIQTVINQGGVSGIADVLFGPFLLAFFLVGVLLLTGIVGAVGLVQPEAIDVKRESEAPSVNPAAVDGTPRAALESEGA